MARALYIHWPFCLKKCPYCDFNSHVRIGVDVALWQEALLADMRHEAEAAGGETLASIFFGGGTPSLMPPALVARLLEEAEQLWGFDRHIEITLEANPSSVEAAAFADLAETGVNRISLGLQSLDDGALKFLGRLHDAHQGLKALETAHKVFEHVSVDLIYALPGQSAEEWSAMLARALNFGTEHLSLYQLTIEPNTRFATDVRRGRFDPMEPDAAADLFALTRELTEAAGLPAYEISNHARPGRESRHNLAYWRYQDYCGIGPGAHGRRAGLATRRKRKPENWLEAIAAQGHGMEQPHLLSRREAATEALLMGLRLAEGLDLEALSARMSIPPAELVERERLSLYRDLGFMWERDGRIGVTASGMPVLDALLGELVPAHLATG